jgi:gliding motility-associated-like protein
MPPGSYELVTLQNSCPSASSTYFVLIGPGPTSPQIDLIQPSCESASGTLIVTSPVSATGDIYYLLSPVPSGNVLANATGVFTNLSPGSYSLVAVDSGCSSLPTLVEIISHPLAPSLSVNSSTICLGDSVNLTAQVMPSGGSLEWVDITDTSNSVWVSPSADQTYTVIYTFDGCSVQAEAIVTVLSTNLVLTDAEICAGDSVTLVALPTTPGGTFLWSPSASTSSSVTVSPMETTTYSVSYSIGQCVAEAQEVTVTVHTNPVASFTTDAPFFNDYSDVVEFTNTSVFASSYLWDFGDNSTSDEFNPSHYFSEIGDSGYQISLIAYGEGGCSDTVSLHIFQKDILVYYVPNSFTPDNNGINDIFKPVFTSGFDPQSFRLVIYNHYEDVIFESIDPENGWDGTILSNEEIKICQDGTYLWRIDFRRTDSGEYTTLKGHVNLIR